ncbi:MAG: FAD-dependent oxidoreductase [Candidatus Aegiribacteria sp.]|nr:FAD-dependent oxidoreductase [Candidatus Aegiribacteria sp.]
MRTGVFVCSCGPNIGDRIDIEKIAEEVSKIEGVVLAETHGLLCSPDGKKYLASKIEGNKLERVVIAACSPREHEETFMKVCETAELNPFMMQMANIREQVAWVTPDRNSATQKALRLVRGAINRIIRHKPLEKTSIVCNPEVVIIGGGVAGMSVALVLANADRKITIIERSASLGGYPANEKLVEHLAEKVAERSEITVITGREPVEIVGFFGNFIINLDEDADEIKAGSIVLATGRSVDESGRAVSPEGFREITEMLGISADENAFPNREHVSLAPVSTLIDGVYVTGCAGGLCSLTEAVSRSEAVAGTILSSLIPGREVETEPKTSVISETLCRGCKTCLEVCGYGAISFDEERLVCTVNSVLCKGCGNCAGACPSGAVKAQHFTPDQIRYQMAGLLR